MSMYFERCCFIVLFLIPLVVGLSVVMLVVSCLWSIYSSVVHITSTSRVLANKSPNSASSSEEMKILEFHQWRGLIRCVYLDLNNLVHLLNINGLRLLLLILVLIVMMRCYVCEILFDFFGSGILNLGVWNISQGMFVLIFVLLQLHLIVLV